MKLKLYKSGALVTFEKTPYWYLIAVRDSNGALLDKMHCDDYKAACAYHRAFHAIARGLS